MENILNKIGIGRKDAIPVSRSKDALHIYVKCSRCDEIIPVRISLKDEVQENYDTSKDKSCAFFVRKEVSGSGSNRCFARVSVYLEFDGQFKVIDADIKGGTFVEKAEYDANI
mgnify:CR=1 FL=1|jgi:hypothetical protein